MKRSPKRSEISKKEANKEMEALLGSDKPPDVDKFAADMMTAGLEGLNMMFKPALYILAILTEEYKGMVTEMRDSTLAVQRFVDDQRDMKSRVPQDAKCPVYDRTVEAQPGKIQGLAQYLVHLAMVHCRQCQKKGQ